MELQENKSRFDEFQMELLRIIAKDIRTILSEKGVPEDSLYDLTDELTFSISSIIDGSRVMDLGSSPIKPVLTFEEPEGTLVHAGGSWMHEYAVGCVEDLFDEED